MTATVGGLRRSTYSAWRFLVPFMVVYLVFVLWPVVQAVWIGFFERDLLRPKRLATTLIGLLPLLEVAPFADDVDELELLLLEQVSCASGSGSASTTAAS